MSDLALPNLSLQVTQECNLACTHCDFQRHLRTHAEDRPAHMSPDFFAGIVEQYQRLKQNTPKSLSLAAGGEALVHPTFLDLCACANDSGISFGFDTNAMLLTPEVSERLLSMPNFERIVFSIDSLDPATYSAIRRGANLEQVHGNVLGFLRLAKAMEREDISTRVNMVVQATNIAEKYDMIRFWTRHVDQVNVTEQRFGTKVPTLHWQPEKREPCRFLWNYMRILTDGDVVVCCLDDTFSSVVGNLDNSTLADVWNGPEYQELRAKQATGNFTKPEICRDCNSWAGFYPPKEYRLMLPHIVCGERPMNLIAMSLPLNPVKMVKYLAYLHRNRYKGS